MASYIQIAFKNTRSLSMWLYTIHVHTQTWWGGIRLSLLYLYCKPRRLLQHFQNSFLLKLMNNLSKGMLQRILQVTSVNQLRCLIFTDIYKLIIIMVQVIVWTHKLKKKLRSEKNVCLLSWIGEQTNLLKKQT